jgi:hypothetical protein
MVDSLLKTKAVCLYVVCRIVLQISHGKVNVPCLVLFPGKSWLDFSIKSFDRIGETLGFLQFKKLFLTNDILYGILEPFVENQRASYRTFISS